MVRNMKRIYCTSSKRKTANYLAVFFPINFVTESIVIGKE